MKPTHPVHTPTATPSGAPTTELRLASGALAAALRESLRLYLPFSQMSAEHIDRFVAAASEVYFAPDEVMLQAESGPVDAFDFLRPGAVPGPRRTH